jgi:hypothetical protein
LITGGPEIGQGITVSVDCEQRQFDIPAGDCFGPKGTQASVEIAVSGMQ